MVVWDQLTNEEIDLLDRSLPVVVPMGLIESHGAHLAVDFDVYSAVYFANRLCELTGSILCPTLAYGFADSNREYVGTLGLKADTVAAVVCDICESFCRQGFTKVIFISGHGGNEMPAKLGFQRAWVQCPDLKPAYWSYFTASGLHLHHGDAGETSIALAIGGTVHMDRAVDHSAHKPWHDVRSRAALDPASGGVNGRPSEATRADGEDMVAQVVRVLGEKLRAAVEDDA